MVRPLWLLHEVVEKISISSAKGSLSGQERSSVKSFVAWASRGSSEASLQMVVRTELWFCRCSGRRELSWHVFGGELRDCDGTLLLSCLFGGLRTKYRITFVCFKQSARDVT